MKPLRLLLILVSLIALCGCGQRRQAVELEFWLADFNEQTRALIDKQLVPQFEAKHPGVKVNTQYISWAHLDEKLTISFAGGVAPDVFQVGAEYVGGLAYRGMAQSIDEYVNRWGAKGDFFPASWNTCVYQNRVYGLPYLSAPRGLLYRKDLLKAAGFERPPDTWEELAAAAQRMTVRDGPVTEMAGMNLPVSWQIFVEFLWENGGRIFSDDGRRSELNAPAAVEALQFYVDLYNKYHVCPTAGMPQIGGSVPVFASKKAAMEIMNQFGIYNITKYAPELLPLVDVAPTPKRKQRVISVYTDWLAMSPQSRHKDLAWELMAFLTEPKNLAAYNATLFFIPPRRSAAKSADFMQRSPQLQEFVGLMDRYGRSLPAIPEWFEIRTGLQSAIEAAIYGSKTPRQALNDYSRELDALLAERTAPADGS
ncbi:MAG: ABC transporter substrate-binding protein [Armatimonadota bacterium]|jgi:multiple sugar transport system substrate-binding protein